jgi:hypothetical protein
MLTTRPPKPLKFAVTNVQVPVEFLSHYILLLLSQSRKNHNTKHLEICALCRVRTELLTRETRIKIVKPRRDNYVRLVKIPNFDY